MLTEHGSIQAVNFCMGKLWLGTFAWVDSLIKDGKNMSSAETYRVWFDDYVFFFTKVQTVVGVKKSKDCFSKVDNY